MVDLWDYHRSEPIHSFEWGCDSITTVAFNPAQPNLIASTASDRSIVLHDTRTATPVRKVILYLRTLALAWNPQEPMNFAIAEDHNAYTFDMRNLSRARIVHKDHVMAVMDVSFAPHGRARLHLMTDHTFSMPRAGTASNAIWKAYVAYSLWTTQPILSLSYRDRMMPTCESGRPMRLHAYFDRTRAYRKQNYYEKLKKKFAHTKEAHCQAPSCP